MFSFVRRRAASFILMMAVLTLSAISPAVAQGQVNIYSYRLPELIQPLLDEFTAETGIQTRILSLTDGVLERVRAEGVNSPADILLTVDVGRLVGLKDGGVTQPVDSEVIDSNIPERFRDPDGEWFGLTMRGRVVYASKDRVETDEITYAQLADPEWRGRFCIRSGQHPYNIALIASIIAHEGEQAAEEWLRALKANLARPPTGSDRSQGQSIYAGECDIALGNTYYVGLMMTDEENPEQQDWAASLKILFPNADGRGTHVNLSGMAMAKYAPNRENALTFMEFLSSAEAQEIYAHQVYEYPLKPGTQASEIVQGFGDIHPDDLSFTEIAANRALASQLVDRVGFDN